MAVRTCDLSSALTREPSLEHPSSRPAARMTSTSLAGGELATLRSAAMTASGVRLSRSKAALVVVGDCANATECRATGIADAVRMLARLAVDPADESLRPLSRVQRQN